LFASAKYAVFTHAIKTATDTICYEDLHLVAIEKAIPSVNERLWSMTSVMQTGQVVHTVVLAQVIGALHKLIGKLDDFLTGSFSLTFTPGQSHILPQGYNPAGAQCQHTPPSPLDLNVCQPPAVDLGGPALLAPTALEARVQAQAPAPSYKLSRQVTTVPDLWREWTMGLGGLPLVAALDAIYRSCWRLQSERQYYSMHKVIINKVIALARKCLNN
jgi:hypothetical protein